jgi:hypothetical protein
MGSVLHFSIRSVRQQRAQSSLAGIYIVSSRSLTTAIDALKARPACGLVNHDTIAILEALQPRPKHVDWVVAAMTKDTTDEPGVVIIDPLTGVSDMIGHLSRRMVVITTRTA